MTDKEHPQVEESAGRRETESRPAASGRDGRRRKLIAVISLAVIAVLVVFLLLPKKKAESGDDETKAIVSVRVAKAERQPIAASISALGTVFPRQQATVSAKIAGQIKSMGIVRNKPVRAGEVVATLETRDLQSQRDEAAAALEEARLTARGLNTGSIPQTAAQDEKALRDARANARNARATYERRRTLYDNGGISLKDLEASQLALTTAENDLQLAESTSNLHKGAINPNDRALARSRVEQAQQRLGVLEAQLSYASIRSPLTGVITDQFQFQGEYAAPGARLFNVADTSEVIVKAPFADIVAASLKTGDPATIELADEPGEHLAGRISLISRAGDPASRTFEVWVNLKNADGKLKPGSSARMTVETKAENDSVTAPVAAVTLDATNAEAGAVMVVDDEMVAHEVKVTVGIRAGDRIQIKSGLKGGETVIVEGNYALPDGTKVKINEGAAGETEKEPASESGEKD